MEGPEMGQSERASLRHCLTLATQGRGWVPTLLAWYWQ